MIKPDMAFFLEMIHLIALCFSIHLSCVLQWHNPLAMAVLQGTGIPWQMVAFGRMAPPFFEKGILWNSWGQFRRGGTESLASTKDSTWVGIMPCALHAS